MKTLTIGRGEDCHIVLHNQKVSRKHALLRLYPTGKMEIIDMGQNGTYVNGIKIPTGKPIAVKRSDAVIFAQEERLDWKLVPQTISINKWIGIFAAIVLTIVLIVVATSFFATSDTKSVGEMGGGSGGTSSSATVKDKSESEDDEASGKAGKSVTDFFPKKAEHHSDAKQKTNKENESKGKTEVKEKTESKQSENAPSASKTESKSNTTTDKNKDAEVKQSSQKDKNAEKPSDNSGKTPSNKQKMVF